MLDAGQRLHRQLVHIGHAVEREAAAAALNAGVRAFSKQPAAGFAGDPLQLLLRPFPQRSPADQQHDIAFLAQHARGIADGVRVGVRYCQRREGRRDHPALIPGTIGREDQRRHLTRRGARGLDRHRRIGPDILRPGRGPHESGRAARPAFRIGG